MQKTGSKKSQKLIWMCSLAYFVSYLTRVNFAAVIAAIVSAGDVEKSLAGMVTTLSFITYGVGQLISGWLGDRINPKMLITIGFMTTAVMNLLIPFCPNGIYMCVVWAVNGFAQSFMWPPMLKIMKTVLDNDSYNKGCVRVSWGSTIATIMIYLVSPLLIKISGWRLVFFVASACGLAMSALWYRSVTSIEKMGNVTYAMHSGKKGNGKKKFNVSTVVLVVAMLAIGLQGSLRDGVTTWVPTLVSEVYNFGSEISILSSVIVPIFGTVCLQLTEIFFNKMGKRPFVCSGILFAVAVLCSGVLVLLKGSSFIVTITMCAIIVGVMHGINLILIGFLPGIYADEENVSSLSGLLNFTTYVGSAISTYGFAVISEKSGWNATLILWLGISIVGVCAVTFCNFKSKKTVTE